MQEVKKEKIQYVNLVIAILVVVIKLIDYMVISKMKNVKKMI